MSQTELSLAEGIKEKEAGQVLVESNNQSFVDVMRGCAIAICMEKGSVTSDDLRVRAQELGLSAPHKNAWGSIFSKLRFKPAGFVRSKLPSNHARFIQVWKHVL